MSTPGNGTRVVRLRVLGGALELRDDVPKTRADCPKTRPCGHVRCRYHLWRSDAQPRSGRLKPGQTERPLTAATLEPRWLESPMPPSCALDVAEAREREHPGELLGYRTIGHAINRSDDVPARDVQSALDKLRTFVRNGSGGGGDSKP